MVREVSVVCCADCILDKGQLQRQTDEGKKCKKNEDSGRVVLWSVFVSLSHLAQSVKVSFTNGVPCA